MKANNSKVKKTEISAKKLMYVLGILFILAFSLIIYFIKNPIDDDPDRKINIEIIKSLLTILGVAIVGGVVTAFFKSYERNQEQLKLRLQAKLSFMTRLGELYRGVKKSRRKLNANGIEASELSPTIPLSKTQIEAYKQEMGFIDSVQLELEGFKAAVKNEIFFSANSATEEALQKMESYLRAILKEFEHNIQNFSVEDHVNLDELPYLKEFTFAHAENTLLTKQLKIRSGSYCFKANFSASYYQIYHN